jgi:hypothetical protein
MSDREKEIHMLQTILKPFTTARPIGTVIRDALIALGSIATILGIIGFLTEDQVAAIKEQIEIISGQLPALIAASGILMVSVTSILRSLNFSSSDKAAEAAKRIDAELPPSAPVKIETPPGQPDIVVKPK